MRRTRALCLVLLALAVPISAVAQSKPSQGGAAEVPLPPPAPFRPTVVPEGALPPYEADLERLAETLGTLAYLRDLCGRGDGGEWRSRMASLLDAEAKTGERRERLAGAFNRGFDGYRLTYHSCTPAAELIIMRALAQGDQLTRDLMARYGGG